MRLFLKKNRNQVIFQFGTQNFQCFGDVELHTFDGNAELFRYLFVRSILITAQYENVAALVRHACSSAFCTMRCISVSKDRRRFAGFQVWRFGGRVPAGLCAIDRLFGPQTHLFRCAR